MNWQELRCNKWFSKHLCNVKCAMCEWRENSFVNHVWVFEMSWADDIYFDGCKKSIQENQIIVKRFSLITKSSSHFQLAEQRKSTGKLKSSKLQRRAFKSAKLSDDDCTFSCWNKTTFSFFKTSQNKHKEILWEIT